MKKDNTVWIVISIVVASVIAIAVGVFVALALNKQKASDTNAVAEHEVVEEQEIVTEPEIEEKEDIVSESVVEEEPQVITITGKVLDEDSKAPVSEAAVSIGDLEVTTDSNGIFEIVVDENTEIADTIHVSAFDYEEVSEDLELEELGTAKFFTIQDIPLVRIDHSAEWKQAYIDFLNDSNKNGEVRGFILVDMNEDDVPEMLMNYCEHTITICVSWYKGETVVSDIGEFPTAVDGVSGVTVDPVNHELYYKYTSMWAHIPDGEPKIFGFDKGSLQVIEGRNSINQDYAVNYHFNDEVVLSDGNWSDVIMNWDPDNADLGAGSVLSLEDDTQGEGDYTAAMNALLSSYPKVGDERYTMGYIDGDDIPEVFISEGSSHASRVNLYFFIDGTYQLVGSVGSNGSFSYKEYGNMICEEFNGMGQEYINLWSYNSNTRALDRVWSLEGNELEGYFEIEGSEVSFEEYDAARKECWEMAPDDSGDASPVAWSGTLS